MKPNNLFLKFILFIGLAFLTFTCEQDKIVNEAQEESILKNQKTPTIRTFSQDNIGDRFNHITQQLNIKKYLKKSKDLSYTSRNSYDTLGVTIYTDEIKEVTIDDYTSYTMRMATPETDSTSFYNVTIEDDNGVTEMYVIKYTPEETWLNNKDQPYEGNITTTRVNNFTYILPDDQGGGTSDDYGDLGYNFTEPQGSPYYPTDCNGIVYVTMESIPYQCSCEDHWPNQTCYCGINGNPGCQPGFNEVPYYYCDENNDTIDDSEQSGNTNTDTTTGGTSTTGSANNSNPDNNLITVLLNPDEECEAPEGDLNGDCILDNYEVCLLNGYNQDICDCVTLGNQLIDCKTDYLMNNLTPDEINEFNWYSDITDYSINVNDYMNCFTNASPSTDATYEITIYVEQPVPNSTETYSGTNPGHTFIKMSIVDGSNSVSQTFGFYPSESVNPVPGPWHDITANGEIRDNSSHLYHVSASINIQNEVFFNIVDTVNTLGNDLPEYNLDNYNCSDFGLTIANQAGMNIPDTYGECKKLGIKLGGGTNPGNLGQDIRNLDNPNVTITETDGDNAPNGNGPCN